MIEVAQDEDGLAILALAERAGVFKPVEVACVAELWDLYQKQRERSGYTFAVYREAGRVLGFTCFGPHPLTEGTFDLYWIAVDPACRGRGIGHRLLAYVEFCIRQQGGRLLVVETSGSPAYENARRLYQSGGYHQAGYIPDFYGPGDALLVFCKELTPAMPVVAPSLQTADVPI